MKVLFVINSSNNGGAIKMIVTLYKEMKKRFPACRIIFLKKIESQYSDIDGAFYLTNRLRSPLDYFNVYKKLEKIIDAERPDALISFLPLANIFAGILGRKKNIKIRIASQRNPPQIYGRVVRFLDKFIGARDYYTANVCNSEAGMKAFQEYPASYRKHLSVINNCVEPADFSIEVSTAKEKLGIPTGMTIITCVGRLHEQKNHEILIKAMKEVDRSLLYCAGDGPLRQEITDLMEKEGVTDKVILLGDLDREKVRLLLRSSDLFVIPSRYEGLSNSLIEAMSYGLPIIFSNIPSFTSFLQIQNSDEYAGVLVKSNDKAEWAEAMNRLIKDSQLISTYQQRSLAKVADLTPEKMTTKFIDLFYEKN